MLYEHFHLKKIYLENFLLIVNLIRVTLNFTYVHTYIRR